MCCSEEKENFFALSFLLFPDLGFFLWMVGRTCSNLFEGADLTGFYLRSVHRFALSCWSDFEGSWPRGFWKDWEERRGAEGEWTQYLLPGLRGKDPVQNPVVQTRLWTFIDSLPKSLFLVKILNSVFCKRVWREWEWGRLIRSLYHSAVTHPCSFPVSNALVPSMEEKTYIIEIAHT